MEVEIVVACGKNLAVDSDCGLVIILFMLLELHFNPCELVVILFVYPYDHVSLTERI